MHTQVLRAGSSGDAGWPNRAVPEQRAHPVTPYKGGAHANC